jgi:cell shape-determining protein MreC
MKIYISIFFLTVISSRLFSQNSFPVTGNVLIGTTTSNGYLLQVNGNGYFNGAIDQNKKQDLLQQEIKELEKQILALKNANSK